MRWLAAAEEKVHKLEAGRRFWADSAGYAWEHLALARAYLELSWARTGLSADGDRSPEVRAVLDAAETNARRSLERRSDWLGAREEKAGEAEAYYVIGWARLRAGDVVGARFAFGVVVAAANGTAFVEIAAKVLARTDCRED